jgi:hypothetical protein
MLIFVTVCARRHRLWRVAVGVGVQGYGTADGSQVWAYYPCHPSDPDPAHRNEAWNVNGDGTITEIMTGKCLDTEVSGTIDPSDLNAVVIRTCNGKTTQQVSCRCRVVLCCQHRGDAWLAVAVLLLPLPQWSWDSTSGLIHNNANVSGVCLCVPRHCSVAI